MTKHRLNIDGLKKFAPLQKLNEHQLVLLESKHEVKLYKKNQVIIESGSTDNIEYFLIKGKLKLTADDGRGMVVDTGSKAAENAIAHLQPRQYTVEAVENTAMLMIDWSVLAHFLKEAPKVKDSKDDTQEYSSPTELIIANFTQDLANNTLSLPSLPDMAMRIGELIAKDDCTSEGIATVINRDPAMAVKLISAANSPLFRGMASIKTCEDAISRLGQTTTQRLIRIYTLRELFSSNTPAVKDKMQSLWQHCEEVASIAFVLAKYTSGLSPDQAMLAGLIHDVGAIPLLNYIEAQSFMFEDPGAMDEVLDELKAMVGSALLQKWNWPDDLIKVAANAENWEYEQDSDQPDYVDLVVMAQLHAAIGKREFSHFPKLDTVASFGRMQDVELNPDKSFQIINFARADIDAARGLLKS